AGSGFERCEATARRVAGRKARHKLPGIKHAKKPHAKAWGFFVFLLFAGKRSPGQDKIVGNNVERR
ncbi:TPA: hypothetical protein ACGALX_000488, partial [Raoultella ornithinolytica]